LTATPTMTETLVSTFSDTPTGTAVLTATPTFTETPVASGGSSSGVLTIVKAVAAPNPVNPKQLTFAVNLSNAADAFELKLYSPAMVCLGTFRDLGNAYSQGWNKVQFRPGLALPSGICFGRLTAFRAGRAPVVYGDPIKLVVLY
jgi:hypothetical protein